MIPLTKMCTFDPEINAFLLACAKIGKIKHMENPDTKYFVEYNITDDLPDEIPVMSVQFDFKDAKIIFRTRTKTYVLYNFHTIRLGFGMYQFITGIMEEKAL
jgi:hypothetical protein